MCRCAAAAINVSCCYISMMVMMSCLLHFYDGNDVFDVFGIRCLLVGYSRSVCLGKIEWSKMKFIFTKGAQLN